MTGHLCQDGLPLLLRLGRRQHVHVSLGQSPWWRNTAGGSEDDHVVGPDEQEGDDMEDDPADDLLHHVGHDQDHGGHEVRVVAPAYYQGYEYHR